FSGTAWNVLPFPGDNINGDKNTSVTGTRHSAITLDHDNNPCIAYFNTANNNKATVIRYNRSSSKWELLGVLSGRDVNYINITRSLSGDLYAAFMDIMSLSANASVLRVFKLSAGSTTWTELVHAPAERGVDEPVQNISIAVSAANKEYLAYTKVNSSSVVTPIVRLFSSDPPPPSPAPAPDPVVTAPKQMEMLDRGLVAVKKSASEVYIGWRMFGTDPAAIGFNVYRDGVKLNNA